jgi:cell division transport system permease protein
MQTQSFRHLKRFAQLCVQNLERNFLLSLATIVMMALILFIFNVMIALNILAQTTLSQVNEKIDLIVYVSDEASVYQITDLIQEIEKLPEVKQVEYTSKGDALKQLLEVYPDQSNLFTLYGIGNPLPANLKILTKKPSDHEEVLAHLKESGQSSLILNTESSEENQSLMARLLKVTSFVQKLILGVTLTFIIGSILMIMNAIHLSIFTRKTEIQIMQLVGAKPGMIRGPFLMEGAFYATGAVLLSFLLLLIFIKSSHLSEVTGFDEQFHPLMILGGELLASLILGVLSSSLALSYYLKRSMVLDA